MASAPLERIEAALVAFLDDRRRDLAARDPAAVALVDEIRRLVDAGGKRIRPACCYWGYRAAGGDVGGASGEAIVRAAASVELLHTMALVHDDLIDGAKERRGVPTTSVWFAERAEELGAPGDAEAFGPAIAILVGDLAAVLADRMLVESGFPIDGVGRALAVSYPMREAMAAGQFLDVAHAGGAVGEGEAAPRAALKGGGYTIEGPLLIGAALADASDDVRGSLSAFGRPLGQAFQLRDDLLDGDAAPGVSVATVNGLVDEAKAALDPAVLPDDAVASLHELADRVAT